MPRYLPIQRDAADPEIEAVYDRVEKQLGYLPNVLKTLAHNPAWLGPLADLYVQASAGESSLGQKIKALVVLKVCKVERCGPTIEEQTRRAREAGLTDEQIAAMNDFQLSDLFDVYEKDALSLVEYLLTRPDEIPQAEFWTQLDNHFTSDQVVEMMTLTGFYSLINRLILAVQVAADPEPQATLS